MTPLEDYKDFAREMHLRIDAIELELKEILEDERDNEADKRDW